MGIGLSFYNASEDAIDLAGYFLSDRPQAELWQLILSTSESYAEFDAAIVG